MAKKTGPMIPPMAGGPRTLGSGPMPMAMPPKKMGPPMKKMGPAKSVPKRGK